MIDTNLLNTFWKNDDSSHGYYIIGFKDDKRVIIHTTHFGRLSMKDVWFDGTPIRILFFDSLIGTFEMV